MLASEQSLRDIAAAVARRQWVVGARVPDHGGDRDVAHHDGAAGLRRRP